MLNTQKGVSLCVGTPSSHACVTRKCMCVTTAIITNSERRSDDGIGKCLLVAPFSPHHNGCHTTTIPPYYRSLDLDHLESQAWTVPAPSTDPWDHGPPAVLVVTVAVVVAVMSTIYMHLILLLHPHT